MFAPPCCQCHAMYRTGGPESMRSVASRVRQRRRRHVGQRHVRDVKVCAGIVATSISNWRYRRTYSAGSFTGRRWPLSRFACGALTAYDEDATILGRREPQFLRDSGFRAALNACKNWDCPSTYSSGAAASRTHRSGPPFPMHRLF